MSRTAGRILLALALLGAAPAPAPAQDVDDAPLHLGRAALGSAIGVAGGAVVTVSVVVARARFQREYLDSAEDLVHWQSTPLIVGPAIGAVFGLAGEEALLGSFLGSVAGLVGGAGVGAGLGWVLSTEQEWPWAGAVIGAGVGMTVAGIYGGLRAWSRDDDPELNLPGRLRLNLLSVPVR